MESQFKDELTERLIRYTAIDSQSDELSDKSPSTDQQFDMLNLLKAELVALGARDVELTDYGVVLATVPGNISAPPVGFLAHVDTAPQFNASGVKPRLIKGYNGGDITFPDDAELILSPNECEYLKDKKGEDIITASGTTLLGADDKAGVSIIMTAVNHLMQNSELKHGPIRVAFTPDEEIGRGVTKQLVNDLGVDTAYTFDGGKIGDLEYETFSADKVEVNIKGVSIHPGLAKDKLVNAIHIAAKIISTLPQATLTPETTEDNEGFIHATDMVGGSSEMTLRFILRDFELVGLKQKGDLLKQVCEVINSSEPRAEITCEIIPQYRNMRYWLEKNMRPVEIAKKAMENLNITPVSKPIRGGTDGSLLTELGVPTPNLFTGMQNIHGPLEWISAQDMEKATHLCLKIIEEFSKEKH